MHVTAFVVFTLCCRVLEHRLQCYVHVRDGIYRTIAAGLFSILPVKGQLKHRRMRHVTVFNVVVLLQGYSRYLPTCLLSSLL
jgi:hypothetical protein